MTIGIDLRCVPGDGSPGAGVAHAARAMTTALMSLGAEGVTWQLYTPELLGSVSGFALRRALKKYPCDVLFVPSGAVAPWLDVECVPWVHDVAIFEHPEWFGESFFRRIVTTMLFWRGLNKAKHILAVSEDTKRELVRLLGIDSHAIVVTHEGGDD